MLPRAEAGVEESDRRAGMRSGGVIDSALDRHHRISTGRQRCPGHDPGTGTGADHHPALVPRRQIGDDLQFQHAAGAIPAGRLRVGCAEGEAIHHRPVPGRGIDIGNDRDHQAASERLRHTHPPWSEHRGMLFDECQACLEIKHLFPLLFPCPQGVSG